MALFFPKQTQYLNDGFIIFVSKTRYKYAYEYITLFNTAQHNNNQYNYYVYVLNQFAALGSLKFNVSNFLKRCYANFNDSIYVVAGVVIKWKSKRKTKVEKLAANGEKQKKKKE